MLHIEDYGSSGKDRASQQCIIKIASGHAVDRGTYGYMFDENLVIA